MTAILSGRIIHAAAMAAALALVGALPSAGVAQVSNEESGRWTMSFGIAEYEGGTGACGGGVAAVAGLDWRTQGRWVLGAGSEFIISRRAVCTDHLAIVSYPNERWATEAGGLSIMGPRLHAGAGYRIRLENLLVEPALGGGLGYSLARDGGLFPWTGATLRLHRGGSLAVNAEYGWNWVKIRHDIHDAGGGFAETRTFRRAAPMMQLSVSLHLGG